MHILLVVGQTHYSKRNEEHTTMASAKAAQSNGNTANDAFEGLELGDVPFGMGLVANKLDLARNALHANLREHLADAQAMVDGKPGKIKRKWVLRGRDGNLWLSLRLSNRMMELNDRGQKFIRIARDEDLPKVLETLIERVESGALDPIIEKAIASKKPRQMHRKSEE